MKMVKFGNGAVSPMFRQPLLKVECGYNPSLKLAYDVAKALESKIEEVFIFEDG